jgi:hypothetical protein
MANFRPQLARTVRLWHIVITFRRPRYLFFPIQRVGGHGDDWIDRNAGLALIWRVTV